MAKQTSTQFFHEAAALRDRIVSRQINETPAQAWAAVCRACANASSAFYREEPGVHGRRHQAFLNNLDAIWWPAQAQVETLSRSA